MDRTEVNASDQQFLRDYLATRDVECPVCAYNLRGLDSEHCPECGAILDIRIGSTDLRMGRWITSLILCAIPLGFTFFINLISTMMVISGEVVGLAEYLAYAIFVGAFFVSFGVMTFLIRKRRWFWRQSITRQNFMMMACLLLVLVLIGTFIAMYVLDV